MQFKRHFDKSKHGSDPGKYDVTYQHYYHGSSDDMHTRSQNLAFQSAHDTYSTDKAKK
jgi:hypothetical protein